jgi:hypothetical protein
LAFLIKIFQTNEIWLARTFLPSARKILSTAKNFQKKTNKARFCLAFLIKIFQTNEIWL